MAALTPSTIPQPVDDPTPEIDALVTRLRSAAQWEAPGRYSISSRCAPTEGQRQELTRRADDLRRALSPAAKDEIRTSLLKWIAGLDLRLSEEALDDMVSMFVASLMGLPLWAVRQTLLNWMQGRIANCNPRFTPKPPELRREGDRIVARRKHELGSIGIILSAKVERVPDDAERERAIAYWRETVKPTMHHADVTEAISPEENRRQQVDANDRLRRREREAAGADREGVHTLEMEGKLNRMRARAGIESGEDRERQQRPETEDLER
ncbi:hypothetical protein LNAOJCKE_4111 [Methylorubrum aminovorans]|uniref:Uncharacterized protein n=1 Tax=Methylorubrum aminovorans TaxID=269069 RepID=A0ABQ4UID9_9HYPH|nr:hypothetical protein [Methylorubrum aminovorans]GJE66887.1 hypothetical protein LNAOJCKE_4111 [Methylorubrum aminovorans]GMA74902.1 hypothetical protein GCM10025880_13190 [Methylorubrum aminovorans]